MEGAALNVMKKRSIMFPERQLEELELLAARRRITFSDLVRELVTQQLDHAVASHSLNPMIDALHAVLPSYIRPLHDFVASTRYDSIVARELASAAALAALLATGRPQKEAYDILRATQSKAAKTASRRMRDKLGQVLAEAEVGPDASSRTETE